MPSIPGTSRDRKQAISQMGRPTTSASVMATVPPRDAKQAVSQMGRPTTSASVMATVPLATGNRRSRKWDLHPCVSNAVPAAGQSGRVERSWIHTRETGVRGAHDILHDGRDRHTEPMDGLRRTLRSGRHSGAAAGHDARSVVFLTRLPLPALSWPRISWRSRRRFPRCVLHLARWTCRRPTTPPKATNGCESSRFPPSGPPRPIRGDEGGHRRHDRYGRQRHRTRARIDRRVDRRRPVPQSTDRPDRRRRVRPDRPFGRRSVPAGARATRGRNAPVLLRPGDPPGADPRGRRDQRRTARQRSGSGGARPAPARASRARGQGVRCARRAVSDAPRARTTRAR